MQRLRNFLLLVSVPMISIFATSASAAAAQPTYTCYFYRGVYTYSATHKQAKAYEKSSIYFSCQKN